MLPGASARPQHGEIAGKLTAIRPPARYLLSEVNEPVQTPITCPECGTPRGITASRTSICGLALRLGLAVACSFAALFVFVLAFGEVTSTPWVNQAFNFGADGEVLTLGELRRVAAGNETPGFRLPELLASETATLAVDVQQAFQFDSRTLQFGWPAGTVSWFSHAINGAVATAPSRWSFHLGTFHLRTGASGWSISVWPVLLAAAVAVMVCAAARAVCTRVRWSSKIRAERWSLAIGIASGIFLAFVPWSNHDSNRSGVIGPDIPLSSAAKQLFEIKDPAHRARELAVLTVRAVFPKRNAECFLRAWRPATLVDGGRNGRVHSRTCGTSAGLRDTQFFRTSRRQSDARNRSVHPNTAPQRRDPRETIFQRLRPMASQTDGDGECHQRSLVLSRQLRELTGGLLRPARAHAVSCVAPAAGGGGRALPSVAASARQKAKCAWGVH